MIINETISGSIVLFTYYDLPMIHVQFLLSHWRMSFLIDTLKEIMHGIPVREEDIPERGISDIQNKWKTA